ncbi:hypothetical protein PQX77_020639 [Marasmius sp. AFHP31]|nr:hypothetical protein PQX77_020639 [Marasmius sp. AFHP31]
MVGKTPGCLTSASGGLRRVGEASRTAEGRKIGKASGKSEVVGVCGETRIQAVGTRVEDNNRVEGCTFEEGIPHRTLPVGHEVGGNDKDADPEEEGSSWEPAPPPKPQPSPDTQTPSTTPNTETGDNANSYDAEEEVPDPPSEVDPGPQPQPPVQPTRCSTRQHQPSRGMIEMLESRERENSARLRRLDWATERRTPRTGSC